MAETQAPAAAAPASAPAASQQGNNNRQGGRPPRRDNRRDMPQEPKEYDEVVISIDRVARVVKGGRRFRFKALVVVGNNKGKVGVGVSKGQDVQTAVAKATDVAKKNLITVPILNGTIPHDVEIKFSGARVLIKPAAPGTGIIAGGVVRQVIGVTGIHNMLSKSLGSTNKVNIAYAVIDALKQLVPKEDWLNTKKSPATKEAKADTEASVATPAPKKPAAKKVAKEETK